MHSKICKWCGREYDGSERTTAGAGGWAACSESCRINLQASVDSGTTAKNTRTSKTGCLLMVLLLLGGVGFLNKACSTGADATSSEQIVETEQVESVSEEAGDASSTEAEKTVAAEEETVDAATDGEVNESEGEIRMIPAPEEEAETPAPTETEETPSEEPAPTEFE